MSRQQVGTSEAAGLETRALPLEYPDAFKEKQKRREPMWNHNGWEDPSYERRFSACQIRGNVADAFLSSGRSRPTNHERFGHSTSKVPPYWEPALELRGYPFRVWIEDLDVWAAGTELAAELQAPAVVQRLGGGCSGLDPGSPNDGASQRPHRCRYRRG